ncbi:MAG: hypothetical protein WCX46_03420, partial [Candidatus Paceibacterota bacterium]
MKTRIDVNKLGGDFFTAKRIKIFFKIFFERYNGEKTLFVFSAVKLMTRLLRMIVRDKIEKDINDEFRDLKIEIALDKFKIVHLDLISELFLGESQRSAVLDFEIIFQKLQKLIDGYKEGDNENKFYAEVLKFGELSSSSIMSNYLNYIN